MNKLEDVPELKAAFEKATDGFGLRFAHNSFKITAEHFFIAGYEASVAERQTWWESKNLWQRVLWLGFAGFTLVVLLSIAKHLGWYE